MSVHPHPGVGFPHGRPVAPNAATVAAPVQSPFGVPPGPYYPPAGWPPAPYPPPAP
ncbi:response regulator, partial [Mycobacterium palustre]|nr:response regulator [Mycobacterium palustre]